MAAEPPLKRSSTGASDAAAPGSRFQGVEKWEATLIFQMKEFYIQPSTNLKLLTNKGKFNKCDFF